MSDTKKTAAKAAATPDQVTLRITALGPVRHDGETYAEGAEITLSPTAAQALIRSGVAEPA